MKAFISSQHMPVVIMKSMQTLCYKSEKTIGIHSAWTWNKNLEKKHKKLKKAGESHYNEKIWLINGVS